MPEIWIPKDFSSKVVAQMHISEPSVNVASHCNLYFKVLTIDFFFKQWWALMSPWGVDPQRVNGWGRWPWLATVPPPSYNLCYYNFVSKQKKITRQSQQAVNQTLNKYQLTCWNLFMAFKFSTPANSCAYLSACDPKRLKGLWNLYYPFFFPILTVLFATKLSTV